MDRGELWDLVRAVSLVVVWSTLGYTWDNANNELKALGLTGAVAVTVSQVLVEG